MTDTTEVVARWPSLLVAAIFAASWFLLDRAEALRGRRACEAQTVEQDATPTQRLEQKIEVLKAQQARTCPSSEADPRRSCARRSRTTRRCRP